MKIAIGISLFVLTSVTYRIYLAVLEGKITEVTDIGLKAVKDKNVYSYYICLVLLMLSWLFLLMTILMVISLLVK